MRNELPQLGFYGLYSPDDEKWGGVFQLPEGELKPDAIQTPWFAVPLVLVPAGVLPGTETPPTFKLPIPLVTELETNEDAAWPFPQLRKGDPAPLRKLEGVRHITLHHTAGTRAGSTALYCHELHTKSKSWSRCGYHLFIGSYDRGDPIELYEINLPEWVAWHDSRNYDTYAVTMAGWLSIGHDVEPNEAQLDCFGRAMAYALPKFKGLESIVPHKLFQATACPGDIDRWYPLLIDAAKQYGQDIAPLLQFVPTRRARVTRALSARLRYGPPPSDCEDV
jgi:hypothetical protein